MRDIIYLGVIAMILLTALPAWGEGAIGDFGLGDGAFETDTAGTGGEGGQNASVTAAGGAGYVGSMLSDTSNIGNSESLEGDGLGRRQKTEDAMARGKEGVAAAIAAGTALTAAGVAKLPFPTTPQGVALIALGALEFAQAAATQGVTDQNTDGRNILRDGTETGSQSSGASSQEQLKETIKKQIDTPEMREALAQTGVNSDDFVERLASGELKSFDDIMAAVNSPHEFSDEQIAQAQADAMEFFQGGFSAPPEDNGIEEVARIKPDDSQPKHEVPGGGAVGAGAPASVSAVAAAEGAGRAAAAESPRDLVRQAERMADAEIARRLAQGLAPGLSRTALVKKYLDQLRGDKNSNPLRSLSRAQLGELGIKRLRNKQRIFDVSRRTFRSYGDWRQREKGKSRPRLAQVPQVR